MDTFSCPGCRAKLLRTAALSPGDLAQCPRCGAQFAVPPDGAVPTPGPTPSSSPPVGNEGGIATAPRQTPAPAFTDEPPDAGDAALGWHRRDVAELDGRYVVDLAAWWRLAAKHYGAFAGPWVGFVFILALLWLVAGVPCLGLLVVLLVILPLSYGTWAVALREFRRQRWEFRDFFCGYEWFVPILGYVVVAWLVMAACSTFAVGAGVLLAALRPPWPRMQDPAVVFGVLGAGWATSLALMGYLGIRLCTFAPLLIVDRNCGPIEAMRVSWRMTEGKVVALAGLHAAMGFLLLAGYFACGVGLLFVAPMVTLVWTAAYLHATAGVPRRDDEPKGW